MKVKPPLGVFVDESIAPWMLPSAVELLSGEWQLIVKRIYTRSLSEKSQLIVQSLQFDHVDVASAPRRKNAVDFVITCDMLEELYRGELAAFALFTNDGDFVEPVSRIKKHVAIYVFGRDYAPIELQQAATEFTLLTARG